MVDSKEKNYFLSKVSTILNPHSRSYSAIKRSQAPLQEFSHALERNNIFVKDLPFRYMAEEIDTLLKLATTIPLIRQALVVLFAPSAYEQNISNIIPKAIPRSGDSLEVNPWSSTVRFCCEAEDKLRMHIRDKRSILVYGDTWRIVYKTKGHRGGVCTSSAVGNSGMLKKYNWYQPSEWTKAKLEKVTDEAIYLPDSEWTFYRPIEESFDEYPRARTWQIIKEFESAVLPTLTASRT